MALQPVTAPEAASLELQSEAALFGRYLTGRPPSVEVAARYADACRRLFPEPLPAADAALLAFARRRPWAIGPLDAACGLMAPASPLRGRLLLMLALLETSPSHADFFLPITRSRAGLLAALAGLGAVALCKAAAGLPLLLLVRRAR